MVEYLVAIAQGLSLAGLVWGAYLAITYTEDESAAKPVRFDPVTGHVWSVVEEDRGHAVVPQDLGDASAQEDRGDAIALAGRSHAIVQEDRPHARA